MVALYVAWSRPCASLDVPLCASTADGANNAFAVLVSPPATVKRKDRRAFGAPTSSCESVLMDELVVVGHLRIADYIFKAVIFFGDNPDMFGVGDALRGGHSAEE